MNNNERIIQMYYLFYNLSTISFLLSTTKFKTYYSIFNTTSIYYSMLINNDINKSIKLKLISIKSN